MTAAQIVECALAEDVGTGDVSTELCVPADRRATARFIARESAVMAGAEVLPLLYDQIDIHCRLELA
jgi:nicotinate-nucleotide pyrophosphorylase (carboxylating)